MSKRIISSIFLVFLVLTQTFADDVFYFAEDSDINDYDDRELTTGDITTTGTVSTTEGGMGTTGTTGTTGAMSTTGPNGGGTNTTTVYEISVSETENTTATLNSTAGYIVEITFPPLVGGYSARYSQAASDVAGFEDPTTSMPTNGKFKGVSFFITLMKDDSVAHLNFTQPIIVKVVVPEGSSSDAIYLFNTDNLKWEDAAETCNPKRFINNNGNIELGICHLTQFAVFEVTTSQSSTTTTGGAAAVVDEPSEGDDAGLIAAVIIIPIVIVGVIISLVAWTLLRNPEKSRKEKDLEMTTNGSVGNTDMAKSKPLEDSSSSEVESSDEDDDDEDSAESSDDAPKNKNDSDSSSESEKGTKPKPVAINVKKQNRDSSSESSESSSDSDEPVRKNTQKQKKEESSDESDDTTETSDSD